MSHTISGVTRHNFTKFSEDVGQFIALLMHSEFFYPFWNASVLNEGMSAHLAWKLVAMATPRSYRKKRTRFIIFN